MDISKDSIMLIISNISISQESFQTDMEKYTIVCIRYSSNDAQVLVTR